MNLSEAVARVPNKASSARCRTCLLRSIELRKLPLQIGNLGKIVDDDVRLTRITCSIILVVSLSFIKCFQWYDFSDDSPRKKLGAVELRDVRLRHLFLLFIAIENRGSVLRSHVWALAVELSGIMGDGKKHFEQLAVRDSGRVVREPNGFSMPRTA